LEGKFSVYFAAALAIVNGIAGPKQFSDPLVRDPVIVALRDRVTTEIDPALHEDQVRIAIVLKDGRRLEKFIDHAVGSKDRPMTDKDLEAKLADLADGVLPPDRTRRLIDLCWRIQQLPGAAELAKAAAA
jgi:2-methylcitrate dehydratase PrpD